MLKRRIFTISLLVTVMLMIGVQTGTISFSDITVPVSGVNYDEDDVVQFLDSALDNVTVLISEASGAGMGASIEPQGTVLNLGSVRVIACSHDYKVFENVGDGSEMHMASRQFLDAFYSFGRLTGDFNLRSIQAHMSAGMGASVSEIQSMLSVMAENDSAEATGYSETFSEDIAYEDLEADTEYTYAPANYTDWGTLEAEYQDLTEKLSTNDTGDEFLEDGVNADDEEDYNWIVTGFEDTEEAVLAVLKANVAANQSTSSDYITADRVTILDYDVNDSVMTNYFSEGLFNKVREHVDKVLEEESASALMTISFLGFQFKFKNIFVPVKAMPASIQANILEDLGGKILNIGKAFVSAPMKIKEALIDKPLATIKNGITNGFSFVKGAFNNLLSAPGNFVKTVGDTAGKFVQKVAPSVKAVVTEGSKLVGKGFNGLMGGLKGLIGQFAPIIIIVGVVGLGFVLVWLVIQGRRGDKIIPK